MTHFAPTDDDARLTEPPPEGIDMTDDEASDDDVPEGVESVPATWGPIPMGPDDDIEAHRKALEAARTNLDTVTLDSRMACYAAARAVEAAEDAFQTARYRLRTRAFAQKLAAGEVDLGPDGNVEVNGTVTMRGVVAVRDAADSDNARLVEAFRQGSDYGSELHGIAAGRAEANRLLAAGTLGVRDGE